MARYEKGAFFRIAVVNYHPAKPADAGGWVAADRAGPAERLQKN
jgi:hypothetical protein